MVLYIRRKPEKKSARQKNSLLFDLFKSFDQSDSNHKSYFFSENNYFHLTYATCCELPYNISILVKKELKNGLIFSV